MKKAIYKPTNQNTVILSDLGEFCEILLDGEYKTVPKNDLEFLTQKTNISKLYDFKENIFLNFVRKPLSDILYSFNTNRLTPEPHQYKPLIKFLNSENNRILIADEVGLGKTIEAGMIYKEIDKRQELRISLIVVPSSLTLKWQEELHIRFDEWFEVYKTNQFLKLINDFEEYSGSRHFQEKVIVSYHTLRDERVMKKLENSFFEVDFLIMDEAHTMRNDGTSTFDSAKAITNLSDHIVFLSATPVQNSIRDIFNVLSLLDNDYFKDFDFFLLMIKPNKVIHKLIAMLRNNCNEEEIRPYINENMDEEYPAVLKNTMQKLFVERNYDSEKRIKYIDELTKLDLLSFIINRTKKKDVGRSIPRNAKSLIVSLNQNEKNYYQSVISFIEFLHPNTPQGFITIMPERMASSSMIASLDSFKEMKKYGKLFIKDLTDLEDYYGTEMDIEAEALKYLDEVIECGELIGTEDSKFIRFEEVLRDIKGMNIQQLIVFSFFKKTIEYLSDKLLKLGYKVGKIHGDMTVEDRFAKIKMFKKGEFDILLTSEVGSEGLDMQFCNVVINYDLPWNPMRVEQRIGRIDRIGQKFDKLHIFNLCIERSIEDRIYNRLYQKLGIFENSIGELEPILGTLEEEINIAELIHLSQEEIDAKLHLTELAISRRESEIQKQTYEVEKLINDDINHKLKEDELINSSKINILQEQSESIFIEFLISKNINFQELKDGSIKLSNENLKKLISILKDMMSDKRNKSSSYNEERAFLQKIYKQKELKISFSTNNNDEYNTQYIYLNHPVISMISRTKQLKSVNTIAQNDNYINSFAITFRMDLKQLKPKSYIKTIVLNKNLSFVDELDYFEFIENCYEDLENSSNTDFLNVKGKSIPHIIKCINKQIEAEQVLQNRMINTKINSINSYYEKQIIRAKTQQEKSEQEDVQRMKTGEIDNLIKQRDKKIEEYELQKEIKSSFEILGIMELI